jgi:glucose-6-phosphate 1-epimerase
MADFGDDEWPRMLCVESAAIGHHSIELGSGESHALSVTIS